MLAIVQQEKGSMKVIHVTIIVAAALALGESALAGLPPQANSSVTNAAAVTEAKTFVDNAGESLN